MISRRQLLAFGTVAGLPAVGPLAFAAAPAPLLDKDYVRVRPALDLPAKPIIVHDFFAYTCPHCLTFAPFMERFSAAVRTLSDVRLEPVPVAWNEELNLFSEAYFSFEALGLIEKLHVPFWEWIIKETHDAWQSKQAVTADIEKWVVAHGVNLSTWQKAMRSFSVLAKSAQASKLWKNYGIDSTPSVGVAGRYVTAPHMVGNRQGTIDTINYLIDRVRSEK